MKRDCQIEYWAHMLDEAFGQQQGLGDRSYYAVWRKEYPEYADPQSLKEYLVRLFDEHVAKTVPDLCKKLKTFAEVYDRMADSLPYDRMAGALLEAFGPSGLTDRQAFWQPIPAKVYKAMVSRHRDVFFGKTSRGVSPSVLKDCLDTICRSVTIVGTLQDMDSSLVRSKTYQLAIRKCGLTPDQAAEAVCDMFTAFSSFSTIENGKAYDSVYDRIYAKYKDEDKDDILDNHFDEFQREMDAAMRKYGAGQWLYNDSDSGFEYECVGKLMNVPYDVYERPDEAVPLINHLVDRSHIRGDLAGIFVEGGAATCSAVSSMGSDELYESGYRSAL